MRPLLVLAAACGAPATPSTVKPVPSPSRKHVVLQAPSTTTNHAYRVCWADGHVTLDVKGVIGRYAFEEQAASLTPRTLGGRHWHIGDYWAYSQGDDLHVTTSGLDAAAIEGVLARLDDATPDADRRRHHRLGAYHLHLPQPARFSGARFEGKDHFFGIADRVGSQHLTHTTTHVVEGVVLQFRPSATDPRDEMIGEAVPIWQGELQLGSRIVDIHGRGATIDRAGYLAFAESVIRVAQVNATLPCR